MDVQQPYNTGPLMQDRIDAYILDQMSGAERKAFEADLDTDEALREQYELTVAVKDTIAERDEMRGKMRLWREKEKKTVGKSKRVRAAIVSVAAVVVAGVFVSRMLYKPVHDYSVGSDFATYRGGADFKAIATLVNKGEYDKALAAIAVEERTLATTSFSDSMLDDRERIARRQYMEKVRRHDLEALMWLKAHALMGKGDKASAMAVLDSLRRSNGVYQVKADSLYDKWK